MAQAYGWLRQTGWLDLLDIAVHIYRRVVVDGLEQSGGRFVGGMTITIRWNQCVCVLCDAVFGDLLMVGSVD